MNQNIFIVIGVLVVGILVLIAINVNLIYKQGVVDQTTTTEMTP